MVACFRFDPDILVGYEVQMRSWGYLLQRAAALGVDLCQQLSRVPGRADCHHSWDVCSSDSSRTSVKKEVAFKACVEMHMTKY